MSRASIHRTDEWVDAVTDEAKGRADDETAAMLRADPWRWWDTTQRIIDNVEWQLARADNQDLEDDEAHAAGDMSDHEWNDSKNKRFEWRRKTKRFLAEMRASGRTAEHEWRNDQLSDLLDAVVAHEESCRADDGIYPEEWDLVLWEKAARVAELVELTTNNTDG